jgi:hypothetical protein
VTAKEKLRARVETLSEQEAEATLDFIGSRGSDSFARWLASRPEDDEPVTAEVESALTESEADIAAGRTISLEDIKHGLGHQAG